MCLDGIISNYFFYKCWRFLKYNFSTFFKYFSSNDPNENNEEANEDLNEDVNEYVNHATAETASEDDEFETQWKTIPLREYTVLMQLIPQEQKHLNTIREMEKIIESKDVQLEKLQQSHQREENKFINVSHLSTVSFFSIKSASPFSSFQIHPIYYYMTFRNF